MSLATWLSGTFSNSQAGRGKRRIPVTTSSQRRHTFRPGLEALEIRLTLSLTTLASFNNKNGEGPVGGVIMESSGNLYGTTVAGAVYLGFAKTSAGRSSAEPASTASASARK